MSVWKRFEAKNGGCFWTILERAEDWIFRYEFLAPCFFEVQSHPNRPGRAAFAAMVQFFRATSRFLKTSLATMTFYNVAARFVSDTRPGIVRNTGPKVVDFGCNFCTNSKESKQESAHAFCAEDMAITDASSNKNWSEISIQFCMGCFKVILNHFATPV